MNLWLLRPKNPDAGIWQDWDISEGFIVRAEDKASARRLASEEAGGEGADVWLNDSVTRCLHLTDAGPAGVLMCDFHAG